MNGNQAASWFNYALMVRNGDVDKTAHYYVQLATLLMNNARFDKAEFYNQKAIDLLEPFPESINYPDYYYNEGLYYVAVGKFSDALVSLDKGIDPARKYQPTESVRRLLAKGKTSIKIAEELSVSSLTIDTHRRNLMQKFGVKNTAELIKAAMLQQLL